MKILVIEDSERLRRSLHRGLVKLGWTVDAVGSGDAGLEHALTYDYDVLVLDLMLPGMPGLEVLRRLRQAGSDLHVLILSARDQVSDRIQGLELGADDYLTKPFSFDELCARVKALMRRRSERKNPVLSCRNLAVDTARRKVSCRGVWIDLTPKEYALVETLARRPGQVFSEEQLLERLYASDSEVVSNVIQVLVSGIRKKLHVEEEPPILHTRRGYGYYLEPEELDS